MVFQRQQEPVSIPVAMPDEFATMQATLQNIAGDIAIIRANTPEVKIVYQLFTVSLAAGVPFNFRANMTPKYWLIAVNQLAAPAAFTVEISQGEKIYPNERIVLNLLAASPYAKVRVQAKQYNLTLLSASAVPVVMIVGTDDPAIDIVM